MRKQNYIISAIAAGVVLFIAAGVFSQTPKVKAAFLPKLSAETLNRTETAENSSSNRTRETPPVGNYPCYYFGYNYALTSSSLTEISILSKQRMKIVGEIVPFRLNGSTLTLEDGEFAGATAHYKLDSDGKPAIVFVRKENEPKGHKIDVSDTWCYLDK